jgi:hypothetical protein
VLAFIAYDCGSDGDWVPFICKIPIVDSDARYENVSVGNGPPPGNVQRRGTAPQPLDPRLRIQNAHFAETWRTEAFHISHNVGSGLLAKPAELFERAQGTLFGSS